MRGDGTMEETFQRVLATSINKSGELEKILVKFEDGTCMEFIRNSEFIKENWNKVLKVNKI